MTKLTNYQLFDLINRPNPLWLVEVNLNGTNLEGINLKKGNFTETYLENASMKNVTIPDGSIRA